MDFIYYCNQVRKQIGRTPLGQCASCNHLVWVDCPKYEPIKRESVDKDMSFFFSSRKGGESCDSSEQKVTTE